MVRVVWAEADDAPWCRPGSTRPSRGRAAAWEPEPSGFARLDSAQVLPWGHAATWICGSNIC